jgi:hypothetical protein
MGLADRDYMRDRPTERSRPSAPTPAGGRVTGGLLLAVAVSALAVGAGWKGYLPGINISGDSAAASDPRTVRLGTASGFDALGPVGKQWCLRVTGGRVCARTGTGESGRQALTRVLEARGYRIVR